MSNGRGGIGQVVLKQDHGTARLYVGQEWTSKTSWVTFTIEESGIRVVALDLDDDQARQLAALLIAGARQVAADRLFTEATMPQQAAHKAALDEAGREYGEAAGHSMLRTITVRADDAGTVA